MNQLINNILTHLDEGGPGSGFYRHLGRIGKRGGSLPKKVAGRIIPGKRRGTTKGIGRAIVYKFRKRLPAALTPYDKDLLQTVAEIQFVVEKPGSAGARRFSGLVTNLRRDRSMKHVSSQDKRWLGDGLDDMIRKETEGELKQFFMSVRKKLKSYE